MFMNKEKFLKFIIDEIERNQQGVNKTGEGKQIVANLIQIYTLVSDGKFDDRSRWKDDESNSKRISDEIQSVQRERLILSPKVVKFDQKEVLYNV